MIEQPDEKVLQQ